MTSSQKPYNKQIKNSLKAAILFITDQDWPKTKDRRQTFDVLETRIHPNYRIETTPRNDVALLLINEKEKGACDRRLNRAGLLYRYTCNLRAQGSKDALVT